MRTLAPPSPRWPRLGRWLPLGLAALAMLTWPLWLLAVIEAGDLDDLALATVAVLWLAIPAILLVLFWPAGRLPQASVPQLPTPPARPAAGPGPSRPARITKPAPCPHCGLLPDEPKRKPRIIRLADDRRSLAVAIARAKANARKQRARRPPRIIHRH